MSAELIRNLEAMLFISSKPLSVAKLAQIAGVDEDEIVGAVEQLRKRYALEERGMQILRQANQFQMMTNPACATAVSSLYHDELAGELSRPSLETLTIVAYRGPIRKVELDQIRGVNCALILRNLLLRGLIEVDDDEIDAFDRRYSVTMEFLRHMGLRAVNELPEYESLHAHQKIEEFLEATQKPVEPNQETTES